MKTQCSISNKYLVTLFLTTLVLTSGCAKVEFSPVPEPESLASESPTPDSGAGPRFVKATEVVAYGNKQVDFLMVLDDSQSMKPDLEKLASRMEAFVTSLDAGSIDWQMCLTTSRGVKNLAGNIIYGSLVNWSNYNPAGANDSKKVLKRGTGDLNQIFTVTVKKIKIGDDVWGEGLSGDERGIKAAYSTLTNASAKECYRPGAAVSVILISDEDERSVGGNLSKLKSNDNNDAYQPMEKEDYPVNFVEKAKYIFGQNVRLTFNAIIVKPGDIDCEAIQDQERSPSHEGFVYEELAKLTDGGVGSICDEDYSANLNSFRNKIVNSLSALTLECIPLKKVVKVQVGGMNVRNFRLDGKILKFEYPLVEGTKVDLEYECASE